MRQDSTIEAFFILTRAGLFGRTEHIDSMQLDDVDWAEVCHLAEKQSMVGLVEEGVELIQDEWFRVHGTSLVPKKWAVQLVAATMQLEQYNLAMNKFIARLVRKLRKNDIHTLLVKGQGVAQCYERPLWRSSGDVDLLLSDENYKKAQFYLDKIVYEGKTVQLLDLPICNREQEGVSISQSSKTVEERHRVLSELLPPGIHKDYETMAKLDRSTLYKLLNLLDKDNSRKWITYFIKVLDRIIPSKSEL